MRNSPPIISDLSSVAVKPPTSGGAGNGGSDSLSTGTGDGTSSPGIQSIKYSFIPTTWYEVN